MNKVLISGYYGFANAGDEAMLTAIVTALKDECPEIDITVMSGRPGVTSKTHNVKAIHRFNAWGFLKALWSTELVLSGGGSLLQDVTSSKSLFYYLSVLLMAKLFDKKVMLFSQGIGPINNKIAKRIAGWVCHQADLVTVRDDGSYEELKQMGVSDQAIIVTADAVFSLPSASKSLGQEILTNYGVDSKKKIVVLALRSWQDQARYVKEFALAADELIAKHNTQIVFLPLQYPEDYHVAKEVQGNMQYGKETVVLKQGFSTEEYLGIIASADALIGMRLHALVFAAMEAVPFLAISYDPKVERFVNSLDGEIVGKIEMVEASTIIKCAVTALQGEKELHSNIKALKLEARENIVRAITLMRK